MLKRGEELSLRGIIFLPVRKDELVMRDSAKNRMFRYAEGPLSSHRHRKQSLWGSKPFPESAFPCTILKAQSRWGPGSSILEGNR